ncbi:MAG: neutral/alkaline non-lysosomal ceramidase N-terminal domain-containing protein [Clostridia bacterium]|nr:neutral/alkaline non-lysosomal ceramidase N-terminal domain-containing protein [Clostridia bacterium]
MKTGYSKVCINPPYGAPIVGYYQERLTKGILDSIYARAVAFDDGEKKAVVIALDLCILGQKYYDEMKEAVVKATGMDKDAVFITLSHTHTGPLVGKDFASELVSSEVYDQFLINSVRDAAVYAIADLKESTMETAEGEAKNISFIRRYRMKDGYVATNPGVNNPNIDHPLGTPNEAVKLLKIKREGADDIFVVNFGTHPDSVGGDYISADYMGYVCSILENAVPNTKCIFLLGFQGDVNHVNVNPTKGESAISTIDFDSVPRSIEHAQHMGRIIAGAVLSICSITEPVKTDKITYASKRVDLPSNQENHRIEEAKKICEYYDAGRTAELPYKEMELTTAVAEARRIVRLQNGPESFPFYLSAVKIGNLAFAGIGGEPFVEIGRRISAASPFDTTILCCLTNSAGGYIPTSNAYSEGGYEARGSALKIGGDDIIVEGMKELFKEL